MGTSREDILQRLEAAIEDWNVEANHMEAGMRERLKARHAARESAAPKAETSAALSPKPAAKPSAETRITGRIQSLRRALAALPAPEGPGPGASPAQRRNAQRRLSRARHGLAALERDVQILARTAPKPAPAPSPPAPPRPEAAEAESQGGGARMSRIERELAELRQTMGLVADGLEQMGEWEAVLETPSADEEALRQGFGQLHQRIAGLERRIQQQTPLLTRLGQYLAAQERGAAAGQAPDAGGANALQRLESAVAALTTEQETLAKTLETRQGVGEGEALGVLGKEMTALREAASQTQERIAGLEQRIGALPDREQLKEWAGAGKAGPQEEREPLVLAIDALREEAAALRANTGQTQERLTQLEARIAAAPTLEQIGELMARHMQQPTPDAEADEDAAPSAEQVALEPRDPNGQRRRLGKILVEAGVISAEQLQNALEDQAQLPHRRLGVILAAKGYATEELVAQAIAAQKDTPFVQLSGGAIEPDAPALISSRLATHHACIPIAATDTRVTLAMINPLDLIAIDDVELTTNRGVDPVVATPTDIENAIRRFYGVSVVI